GSCTGRTAPRFQPSLHLSHFVARQIWRRRGVSPRRCRGPCTCTLRINTPGSLVDRLRTKKVYMSGLSWPPSGPLTHVDALDAGRVDVRRLLRPPPRAASHHRGWLTDLLAGATAARGTGAPRGQSQQNTPFKRTASPTDTVKVTDPTHPLYGLTFPL